mmetsp:Transcript_20895/g.33838  ORF Transcript_20895/g.33838 Transcript_20895/m.33838 type:complete len:260 (+) Transcript_20895:46-825(+)
MGTCLSSRKGVPKESYKPGTDLEKRLQKVISAYRGESKDGKVVDSKALFTKMQLKFPKFKLAFESVRNLYKSLDENNDGGMDMSEFEKALRQHGAEMSKKDIEVLFQGVDINGDKMLSFKEFSVCMALGYVVNTIPKFSGSEKFVEAFEAAFSMFLSYDKSHLGVIEHEHMLTAFREMGQTSVAEERLKELDPDNDGYITFIEFLTAFQEWVGVEDEEDMNESKNIIEVKCDDSNQQAPKEEKKRKKKHKSRSSGVRFG